MASTKTIIRARIFTAAATLLWLAVAACSSGKSDSSTTTPPPPPPAQKTTYTGTLYMASEMGGHIAVVPVTIDPSNTTTPIALGTITKIQLKNAAGTSAGYGASNTTHVFHDVRLDGTKLYYSAIFPDSTGTMAHLGYVQLSADGKTAVSWNDAVIDATAAGTGMVYCGSGQSADHYFPMTMSSPAYIDAISKAAVTNGATLSSGSADVKRTFVEDFRAASTPYLFAHGVDNPDHSKLFVAVNETSDGTMAHMTGAITGYLLKTSDVAAGAVSSSTVVATKTVTGLTAGAGTIAFRSSFTPDGTKILQASKDRLLVLNAADLTEVDNNTAIGGSFAGFTDNGAGVENHDAMPTPDGKYAILSLRYVPAASGFHQTSGLQLYDLANKKAIGDPVGTCNGCHDSSSAARLTCGIDGKLTAVTQ